MDDKYEIKPGQSVELLKLLHILTRDGKLNQDSRRKLKQVYHLYGFIEPILNEIINNQADIHIADIGAGKSYLGFILYDLYFKQREEGSCIYGIETRSELVARSRELAEHFGFTRMHFLDFSAAAAPACPDLPQRIDLVTALHACDTATDEAIDFALARGAKYLVLAPCCQAEVAKTLRKNKAKTLARPLAELWRHPLHTREFGSHVTNVLRCLRLQAHGYDVSVTELVGWEHSLKNELIIARQEQRPGRVPAERLEALLADLGLEELRDRFCG